MATGYLSHTMSTPTNRKKSTISAWVKKTSEGANSTIFGGGDAATDCAFLNFNTSDKLFLQSATSDSADWGITTSAVFRDSAAWYHVVAKIDTTQSTSTDRVKIYVNGNLQTVTGSYPSQNYDMQWSRNGEVQLVGKYPSTGIYFNGVMAHVHFTDGYAYDASTFGETDSTSGIWKPKTAPSVTYGSKGFFLKFENSGAMGTDSSGNGNNFTTIGGALKQSSDTPSNNFITWNANKKLTITLSNGSTTTSGNGDNGVWSTIGNNQGKWYWETQQNANSVMMGIIHEDVTQTTGRSQSAGAYGLQSGNGSYAYYRNNGSSGQSSGFPEITNSNVLCHALDLDNGKYFLGIDGVFKNLSGTTSNVGTGADPTFTGLDTTKLWFPFTESRGTGVGCDANFGSGFFGTTAVTSANADANGHGAFEYAVPSGYYTLNTKNIKELG